MSLTEYRLQLPREDLKLTGVQQVPWDAYADKVSALAADISRERGRDLRNRDRAGPGASASEIDGTAIPRRRNPL